MRSAVVLPQPEGPTSTANSLSWISMDRSSTTLTAPNCLTTFFRVTPDIALTSLIEIRGWEAALRLPRQESKVARFAAFTNPVPVAGTADAQFAMPPSRSSTDPLGQLGGNACREHHARAKGDGIAGSRAFPCA